MCGLLKQAQLISILFTTTSQPQTSEFFQVDSLSLLNSCCVPCQKQGSLCCRPCPSLSLLPSFLAGSPSTLLSQGLCCHLLLQNIRKFCESSHQLCSPHRLHVPLALNHKVTTAHQKLGQAWAASPLTPSLSSSHASLSLFLFLLLNLRK